MSDEDDKGRLPNGLARGIINQCKVCSKDTSECKCGRHPELRHVYCPECGVVFYTDVKTCQSADPHLTDLLPMVLG